MQNVEERHMRLYVIVNGLTHTNFQWGICMINFETIWYFVVSVKSLQALIIDSDYKLFQNDY